MRRFTRWILTATTAAQRAAMAPAVPFADAPDAFVNLNSPAELAAYEASLSHPEPLAGGVRP